MADSWAGLAYVRGFNNHHHHLQCSSDGTLMDVGRQLMQSGVGGESLWSGMDWQQELMNGNRQQQQLRNSNSGVAATAATNIFVEQQPHSLLDIKQQMRDFHHYPHQNVDPNVKIIAKRGSTTDGLDRLTDNSADSFCTTVNFEWELDQQRRVEQGGLIWRNSVDSKPPLVAPMRETESNRRNCSNSIQGYSTRFLEEAGDLAHLQALDFHQLQEFHQHPAFCFEAPSSQEKVSSNDGSETMDCLMGSGDNLQAEVVKPDAMSSPSPCFEGHTYSSPNDDSFDLLASVSPPLSDNNDNTTTSSFPWHSEFVVCDSFSDDLRHDVSTSLSPATSFMLPPASEATMSVSEPQSHLDHPALDLTREALLEFPAAQRSRVAEAVSVPSIARSLSSSRESSHRRDSPLRSGEGFLKEVKDIHEVGFEVCRERTPAVDTTQEASVPNCENGNHSVQLRNVLMKCAEAIEGRNDESARAILSQLEDLSSPDGDFSQRVALCFSAALSQRFGGHVPINRGTSQGGLLENCALTEACPYSKFVHLTANQALLESLQGEEVLHIIDFGVMQGVQWSALLQALATEPGRKPPRIRITGMASPRLGPNPSASLLATGRRLSEFAKLLGLQLEFCPLMEDLMNLEPTMFPVSEGECVVVNLMLQLHQHVGETNAKLLKLVRGLKPKVVVLVEYEASIGKADFQTRLLDGLEHFSAIFESLDATMPRESTERVKIEKQILAEDIKALFGSESTDATVRHEEFRKWSNLMESLGFKAAPPSHYSTSQARLLLWLYNDNFKLMPSSSHLSLGWQDRRLITVSAWKCC